MVARAKEPIRIDLNQFKLHIRIEHKIELTLHFDSPSRRFYLSVIAFVVNEMQKLGRITSIPLEEHLDLLALLNETVGGSAGSSEKEHLLPRIYRKWKDALTDLENARLFNVLGRKKQYDDGIRKIYRFSEEEKDSWANLFEYKGSGEHVRLRFSIDKLGASLSDVVIIYGEDPELINADAWESFITSIKQKVEGRPKPEREYPIFMKEPETSVSQERKWKTALPRWWKWPVLAIVIVFVVGVTALAVWKYYLSSPQADFASIKKMAFPLPDKPSIAVLPFTNMSADPQQEFFSDGLTEDIITALSKVPKLFVIARNSTFTYKGKPVSLKQVSEELGVQYMVEGSVRRAEERVRITAQLIDALTGHHLWADRYDRDLKDVFAIQDEITKKIITALQIQLTEGEQASIYARSTDNLEAYLKFLEAHEYGRRQNPDDNQKAKRLLEQSIALDPNYAVAYRVLGATHMMDVWLGLTKSPKDSLRKAVELSKKAIALDESLGMAHGLLGHIYILMKDYEKGIEVGQRAVEVAPNDADAYGYLGMGLRFADRPEEAIKAFKRAMRINPKAPCWYLHQLAEAYRHMGRYDEAIIWGKKAVDRYPRNLPAHLVLASIYSLAGREKEAQAEAAQVLRINPNYSLERLAKTDPTKNQDVKKHYIDALRKAGLK
jgi:adenylate cyclase